MRKECKFVKKEEVLKIPYYLKEKGYNVIAPVLKEGVIFYDFISSPKEIVRNVKEIQGRGFYRIIGESNLVFGDFTHGFSSPKEFLHPPTEVLLKLERDLKQKFETFNGKIAFFGIRSCDLKSIEILDNVFIKKNPYPDPFYSARRRDNFTVVINCVNPSENCFCSTVGIDPFSDRGDISLTELDHGFIVRASTEIGKEILKKLQGREPKEEEINTEEELKRKAREKTRKFNLKGIHEELLGKIGSDKWKEIEKRCLGCGNCAMVCPTCFCYDVYDEVNFEGSKSERVRFWDVCFNESFSVIHGHPVRKSLFSRYRQWLMHKFSYWVYQFGDYGCVGCGRCITWCPVGINILEEVINIVAGD